MVLLRHEIKGSTTHENISEYRDKYVDIQNNCGRVGDGGGGTGEVCRTRVLPT